MPLPVSIRQAKSSEFDVYAELYGPDDKADFFTPEERLERRRQQFAEIDEKRRVVLVAEADGKVALVCKVAERLIERGAHAGELVRRVAAVCGGGGGGRAHFAEAGGRDPSKLDQALASARSALAELFEAAQ